MLNDNEESVQTGVNQLRDDLINSWEILVNFKNNFKCIELDGKNQTAF